MKKQTMYGWLLILCGMATSIAFKEISGIGILLILMGVARVAVKDKES